MVLAAYLAGVLTPVAAVLGGYLGARWWRSYRRAQLLAADPLELEELPAPSPPQDPATAPQINRLSFRSVPGGRRVVRGRRQR